MNKLKILIIYNNQRPIKTECNRKTIEFQSVGRQKLPVILFNGGMITSDGGGLLLRKVEKQTSIIENFSQCFTDYRKENRIERTVKELISQRVFSIALGYEDLNDHDSLRNDHLLAVLSGKLDPTGSNPKSKREVGKALAGKSTLNRLEYHEICSR